LRQVFARVNLCSGLSRRLSELFFTTTYEAATMTPWQKRTTKLTQRMADDMLVRNLSQKTIDAYTYHVGRFADFLGKPLQQATAADVREFQLHLIKVRKVGWSSFNQAVSGLRFLYRFSIPNALGSSNDPVR
jgi:site-specific recombinase XerD